MELCLIAMYGIKVIKPIQTLVQPSSDCKELNSYFIHEWLIFMHLKLAERVLVNCGQFCLYICQYPVYPNVVDFYTFEGSLIH